MNAFAKVAATAVTKAKPKKKTTVWPVKGELGTDVTETLRLNAEGKVAKTLEDGHKSKLTAFGEQSYVDQFAETGVEPESPMVLTNEAGHSVTFVIMDKTVGYEITDDMHDDIVAVLGEDAASEILHEQVTFGFSNAVMLQTVKDGSGREVQDVLGERLLILLDEMRVEGLLSQEQVDELLTAKRIRTFRHSLTPLLATICGKNGTRMRRLLDAVGKSVVKFCKA